MEKTVKKQWIEELESELSGAESVVVVHYQGMTVAEVTKLRGKLRASGAKLKVTKNSLAKLALSKGNYAGLADLFTGPTAIAYSNDPVASAKGVVEFAKDNEKLVILGGAMKETALDVNAVKELAKLPSLDELRAKILGLIQAPATRIAGILQAPGGQVARVIQAHSQQGS